MIPMPVDLNKKKLNQTYKLSDFIGKNDEYIMNSMYSHILVDYATLIDNMDLLKHILKLKDKNIICSDYESMIILDRILDKKISISLLDDYNNKDRSYIDLSYFEKRDVAIPLTYIMWNMKINNNVNVNCFRYANDNMFSCNGDTVISKDTISKIMEIIHSLDIGEDDLYKILSVSNYLQANVQYVEDGGVTITSNGKYIVDAPKEEITREKVGSVKTLIENNYGLCMAIANTTTLMLNNPVMGINVRSMFGCNHVWNLVLFGDKMYYIDNTFAITRNPNKMSFALKALSFDDKYILFGKDELTEYHYTTCYVNGNIEEHSYDRNLINDKVKKLPKCSYYKLAYSGIREN